MKFEGKQTVFGLPEIAGAIIYAGIAVGFVVFFMWVVGPVR